MLLERIADFFFLSFIQTYILSNTAAWACVDACTTHKATLCFRHSTLLIFESQVPFINIAFSS